MSSRKHLPEYNGEAFNDQEGAKRIITHKDGYEFCANECALSRRTVTRTGKIRYVCAGRYCYARCQVKYKMYLDRLKARDVVQEQYHEYLRLLNTYVTWLSRAIHNRRREIEIHKHRLVKAYDCATRIRLAMWRVTNQQLRARIKTLEKQRDNRKNYNKKGHIGKRFYEVWSLNIMIREYDKLIGTNELLISGCLARLGTKQVPDAAAYEVAKNKIKPYDERIKELCQKIMHLKAQRAYWVKALADVGTVPKTPPGFRGVNCEMANRKLMESFETIRQENISTCHKMFDWMTEEQKAKAPKKEKMDFLGERMAIRKAAKEARRKANQGE